MERDFSTPRERTELELGRQLSQRGIDLSEHDPDGTAFIVLLAVHTERLISLAQLERDRFDDIQDGERQLAQELVDAWWAILNGDHLDGEVWLKRLDPIMTAEIPRWSLLNRVFESFDEQLRARCEVAESWWRAVTIFLSIATDIGYSDARPGHYPTHASIFEVLTQDAVVAIGGDVSAAREWSQNSAAILSESFRAAEQAQ